jgi:hypothetical protein
VIGLSNADDFREDLELAVIQLRSLGVVPSSIRRYVNAAIRVTEDADGIGATPWLRKRWRREQEPSEEPSRPFGKARSSLRTAGERQVAPDTQDGSTAVPRSTFTAERGAP